MPGQFIAPATVNFSNTSSGDDLTYLWNFGDGGTSTLAHPNHTFTAGIWVITLTVANSNGTDITSDTIIVSNPQGGSYDGGYDGGYSS